MKSIYKPTFLIKNKAIQFFLILSITLILPFLIHKIPSYNEIPTGAILLPMFYFSIPALYLFNNYKLIACSVGFAPIINNLLTGRPEINLMTVLTFELIVYTVIVDRLLRFKSKLLSIFCGGISYILTKLASSASLLLQFKLLNAEFESFLFGSISNALPGIVILCLISYFSYCNLRND